MLRYLLGVLVFYAAVILVLAVAAFADDQPANQAIQEEVWAIPVTLPTIHMWFDPSAMVRFHLWS